MRAFISTLLLVCGLIFSGCFPESRHPLSSPATSIFDGSLEGVYAQKVKSRDDDPGYWYFHYRGLPVASGQKARRAPWIEIVSVEALKNGGLKTNRYQALATRLGGHGFLSFNDLPDNGAKREAALPYHFVRYEVNWRGELRVWLANNQAFAEAIKAGKIRGTVVEDRIGKVRIDKVRITDTTERLAAFIAASDPKALFGGEPLTMRRVAH